MQLLFHAAIDNLAVHPDNQAAQQRKDLEALEKYRQKFLKQKAREAAKAAKKAAKSR